jgi:beta-1,4-mannosyl-glycoprotein beta-1,4-N-acetylglucosaminyltransferase
MVIDCITFFRENFITNIRFEILYDSVDYFVVCESRYDHRGNKKKLNFKLKNKKFKKKIIYLVLDEPFPKNFNSWERQAYQREYIFNGLKNFNGNDYVMFSDPDEIPNPKILKKFFLKKKYGIFLQKHFVYKFNVFNHYSTPWEGTRICKLKDLTSINFMRQKVLMKNLKKWWRPEKEKNIQIIKNGGWHFKDIFSANELSIKLKTFAHTEFQKHRFSNLAVISKKIKKYYDIYGKNEIYKKIKLDKSFPEYIIRNKIYFKKFIV